MVRPWLGHLNLDRINRIGAGCSRATLARFDGQVLSPMKVFLTAPLENPGFNPVNPVQKSSMNVQGRAMRTIWPGADGATVEIIDQTRLPHEFVTTRLATLDDAAHAIRAMLVRGAPLIGATAAWGLWLALRADPSDAGLARAHATLLATRPTAVNLRWALDRVRLQLANVAAGDRSAAARPP